jgi:hypothetical protein
MTFAFSGSCRDMAGDFIIAHEHKAAKGAKYKTKRKAAIVTIVV